MQETQETWVRSLSWEDSLEEGMATHPNIHTWRIPWPEEPGGLQSLGSERVRHDWSDLACTHLPSLSSSFSYSPFPHHHHHCHHHHHYQHHLCSKKNSIRKILTSSHFTIKKTNNQGLPSWSSGYESTSQCRGLRFDPQLGKISHAMG